MSSVFNHAIAVLAVWAGICLGVGCAPRTPQPMQTQAECEAEAARLCLMANLCAPEQALIACCAMDGGTCRGSCATAVAQYNTCVRSTCLLAAQCAMRFRG